MKKVYNIEVDCANCANKMELAIQKLPGICQASVNFMTQKLTLEWEAGASEGAVMKDVLKTCRKIEPDCEIDW